MTMDTKARELLAEIDAIEAMPHRPRHKLAAIRRAFEEVAREALGNAAVHIARLKGAKAAQHHIVHYLVSEAACLTPPEPNGELRAMDFTDEHHGLALCAALDMWIAAFGGALWAVTRMTGAELLARLDALSDESKLRLWESIEGIDAEPAEEPWQNPAPRYAEMAEAWAGREEPAPVTYRAGTVPPRIAVGMALVSGSARERIVTATDDVFTTFDDGGTRWNHIVRDWPLARDWTEPAQPEDAGERCAESFEWGWYVEGGRCYSGFASRADAIRHAVVEHEADRFLVGPMIDVDVAQLSVESIIEDFEFADLGLNAENLAYSVEERLEIEENSVRAAPYAQDALDEWAMEYLCVTALPGAQEALDAWTREHLASDCKRYCAGNVEPEPTAEEIAEARAGAAPSCAATGAKGGE